MSRMIFNNLHTTILHVGFFYVVKTMYTVN